MWMDNPLKNSTSQSLEYIIPQLLLHSAKMYPKTESESIGQDRSCPPFPHAASHLGYDSGTRTC